MELLCSGVTLITQKHYLLYYKMYVGALMWSLCRFVWYSSNGLEKNAHHISQRSERARHFFNRCDTCKVAKVVHVNRSDDHCSWSDTTWPSVLLLLLKQYWQNSLLPSPSRAHTHNAPQTHTLSMLFAMDPCSKRIAGTCRHRTDC